MDFDFKDLKMYCAKKLNIGADQIKSVKLSKKSVDARRKNDVHFIISVDIEAANEKNIIKKVKGAAVVEPYEYKINRAEGISH